MTREKSVIVLQNCASMLHDGTRFMKPEHVQEFREAYEMAIKALKQPEPCEDCISRQAAIDAMTTTLWHYPNGCYRNLNEYEFAKGLAELGLKSVPSAQPEPCEDTDRIYALMKDYYFEHKDKHDASWQGGFGKCMNLIPNAYQKQPEPCEDCVSRADVIELIENSYYNIADSLADTWAMVEDAEKLPSVTPKRKTGEWVERNPLNSDRCRLIECDQCGFAHIVGFNVPYEHWVENRNFCERCGADMRGEYDRNKNH